MMSKNFRVIDTGLRDGRANIAFDQALIDLHQQGVVPDTVRFLHFLPTVLVGRHQALSQEIRVETCKAQGIGIGRRITGGGALYLDDGQMGWELVFNRHTLGFKTLGELTEAICGAAAFGLSQLGIEARYRPRNDIEVGGRKLCGTGGFFDGDTLFYQGTVLIDMDAEKMTSLLNIPDAKLAKHAAASAAQRVVTLRELFGGLPPSKDQVKAALLSGFATRLGIRHEIANISAHEEAAARQALQEEIGTDEFVTSIDRPASLADIRVGTFTGKGGTITAHLRLEDLGGVRVREAIIAGDFFVTPPRIIYDLEASLRGVAVAGIPDAVRRFFNASNIDLLSASPDDFITALVSAVAAK